MPGGPGPGGGGVEQALDPRDGQRDQAGIGRRQVIRAGRRRGPGVGSRAGLGGGDDADGERGHDRHGVPGDRGVQPDLGLVRAEVVLAELKALLGRPAQPGRGDQPLEGDGLAGRDVAVVAGALAGGQVAADQQPVPRAGGDDLRPGVVAVAFRAGPG